MSWNMLDRLDCQFCVRRSIADWSVVNIGGAVDDSSSVRTGRSDKGDGVLDVVGGIDGALVWCEGCKSNVEIVDAIWGFGSLIVGC